VDAEAEALALLDVALLERTDLMPLGGPLFGVPLITTAGSLTSKPSEAYSASDCMLKES
jgi:hypothetical protein